MATVDFTDDEVVALVHELGHAPEGYTTTDGPPLARAHAKLMLAQRDIIREQAEDAGEDATFGSRTGPAPSPIPRHPLGP